MRVRAYQKLHLFDQNRAKMQHSAHQRQVIIEREWREESRVEELVFPWKVTFCSLKLGRHRHNKTCYTQEVKLSKNRRVNKKNGLPNV